MTCLSLFACLAFALVVSEGFAAPTASATLPGRAPHSANPILPGYYADPSVLQVGDKTYIYATLDPWGDKTLGCWESTDFKNWTYRVLNWPTKAACTSPTSGGAAVWAPSVVQGRDGNFYMAISVGNEVWIGRAEHPLGPWANILGDRPLIPKEFKPGYHMIDGELFVDDDGDTYLYWGSGWNWVNGRCFVARLTPDMKAFDGEVKDVTPSNYFEGPVMVKRHGKYFLTYSAGNTTKDTYQVHYAVGSSPFGPFVEPENSPILVTDKASNIVSPGHHTVTQRDGRDYIVYHRHSIPFNPKFVGRQTCIDPLVFKAEGQIEDVVPTHQGPAFVQGRAESRAFQLKTEQVTASSQAGEHTAAGFAVDDNYATHWAAAPGTEGGWLQLDLGSEKNVTRQLLRPEYAWKAYRFRVQYSLDGQAWQTLADHTRDAASGSPILIEKAVPARYLRLEFPSDVKGETIGILEWAVF
jgi:arabinoxylan arabinofuranohydrolase